jgi:hypothetical protein
MTGGAPRHFRGKINSFRGERQCWHVRGDVRVGTIAACRVFLSKRTEAGFRGGSLARNR